MNMRNRQDNSFVSYRSQITSLNLWDGKGGWKLARGKNDKRDKRDITYVKMLKTTLHSVGKVNM